MRTTTSKLLQYSKMWSHAHDKRYCFCQGSFWSIFKRKRKILNYAFGHTILIWSCFVTFCHASPDIFCPKDKNFKFYNSFPTFWGQKLKFTVHLSLFIVTIHCCYSSVTVYIYIYIYIIPISCCHISYHYVFYRFTKLHVTMHFELYIYLDCWIFPIYTNIVLTALK